MLTSTMDMDAPAERRDASSGNTGAAQPTPGGEGRSRSFRSHLLVLGLACAAPFLVGTSAIALIAAESRPELDAAAFLLPVAAAAAVAAMGFSAVTKRLLRACGTLGEATAALAAGRRFDRGSTSVHEVNSIIHSLAKAASQHAAERRRDPTLLNHVDEPRPWREEAVALAAATPDVVVVTDASGRIVEANGRLEPVLGWPAREVVGERLEALLPDFCGGVGEIAWSPGSVLDMTPGKTMKFDGIARDGRLVHLEGFSARWRARDGEPRFSVVLRDVTAERRRYDKLRLAKDTTRRENADKTRFLVAMSDEVREPLNAVVGLADLLLGSEALDEEARMRVGMMRSAGASLIDVVSDAIDLSRLDTGALKLEAKPFSVRTVLQECVAAARSMAPPRDLVLTCAVDASVPPFVLGDAARFRQVALNLVLNVMRLRRRGEAHVSLVALPDREDWLRLDVAESGPGPSEGTLDEMLQDIGPLDDVVARRLGGARMAMTIARRLTDLMDGRIGVSSRGSTSSAYYFEARFPACAPAVVSEAPRPTPEGTRPLRVLVVDDVASNREVAVAVMQSARHEVEAVGGAQEAIEAARASRYDVILMDVEMPDFDGLMATRAIRTLSGPAGRTPILALTAGVYPEQVAACRAAGMDDHIGKPVNFDELKDKVSRWAARGAARSAEDDRAAAVLAHVGPDLRFSSSSVGQARAARLLDALKDRLEEPLSDVDDLDLVRSEAHELVADSGMLGFLDLSQACQDLEAECDRASPVTLASSVARVAAEAAAARAVIERLRR